ncbi:unnamed protein product [Clavelina lepadiformis]|uniref:Coiled-coil domain-containing protein 154-like n=2 Tax=Clavelina lepadiformis TaxID=159417 RepID=A0ABP0FGL6_CLALP
MSVAGMAGQLPARHRLAVLPGLGSRSGTASVAGNDIATTMATLDEDSNNKQLVPLTASNNKLNLRGFGNHTWAGTSLRSRDSEESLGAHVQGVVSRISLLEEANKAILEEVYRLQSSIRAGEFSKKEMVKEEKKVQRELMDTIRSSNDVISQLTSRLRKAEEKLHRERENVQHLTAHTKKLEQALFNTQKEADSQRDSVNSKTGDLRHRVDDLLRRSEKNDRTSQNIVDEFHQMKGKVEVQTMEFSHLQSETKQRTKRLEEEIKQTLQQARFQKDTNSMTEQNNLQLRHMLEARMAESRDAVIELRNRISQTEADARSQVQQVALKLSDLQSNMSDISHRRQEELQSLEESRKEHHHLEENERMKLQKKIQIVVEEMSEKLLQKEVRLREEALKKFIDVEKLFEKEETARLEFEKQTREDNENRWSMQQKLYLEEIQAMKDLRRNDRSRQTSEYKKIDQCLSLLDKKIHNDRKALEKVLVAEITKREDQASRTDTRVEGVQEQLRIALSTLQQAIGGVQFQASNDREILMKEIKARLLEAEETLKRSLNDVDARMTSISMRITQQDTTIDTKMGNFETSLQEKHNELLRSATEWREATNKDITAIQEVLKELPQEVRETQERLQLFKADLEAQLILECQSRVKDSDAIKKDIRQLGQKTEELNSNTVKERTRVEKLSQDWIQLQGTLAQLERLQNDIRGSLGVRINSETKMRMEETSSIKRDLAKLRLAVQPLLWQHNSTGRTFVKTPTSFLNEWGIYQCARWHDIKMRWLRLLDRRRKRERQVRSSPSEDFHSTKSSPDVGSPNPSAGVPTPSQDAELPERPDIPDGDNASMDDREGPKDNLRKTPQEEHSLHEDESDIDVITDDVTPTSEPTSSQPQAAWYNQENVIEDGGRKTGVPEKDGRSEQEENSERPDGDDVRTQSVGESMDNAPRPSAKSNNGSTQGVRNSNGSGISSALSNLSREKSSESAKRRKQSQSSVAGRSAAKSTTSNKRVSPSDSRENVNSASPGGESTASKISTASRSRAKRHPTTGGGQSYDMEGRR